MTNRLFAKVSKIKEGSFVRADAGFTCLSSGVRRMVCLDVHHGLYITCADGDHFLFGQIEDGRYVGLYED